MTKLKPKSLSNKVAEIIIEQIIQKKIRFGERLLEIKIANELEVSQGTVREAFRILEKKKMVTIHGRKGTFVAQIDRSYIESLYDILTELYCLMTRKIAPNISTEDIKEISNNLKITYECVRQKDGPAYSEAMYNGLDLLLRIAKDPLLEHIIKELWEVVRWMEYGMYLNMKNHLMVGYRHLKKYADLLSSGKTDEAIQQVREIGSFAKLSSMKTFGKERSLQ